MKSNHFLFKKSPFGIVYHDINGKIIEVNPTAERILQCPEEKLIAKNINNLAHAYFNHEGALISDNDIPWKRIGIDKKQADDTIIGLQNKDCDDIVWLKVHSFPEYVEEGDRNSLAKVCTMLEDVSDCHRWRMNVLEAGNTQKALMSTSKDCTIIIRKGEIIYVNPESLRVLGYREEEVLGKNIAEFVPPGELEKNLERYNRRTAGESLPEKNTTQAKTKCGDFVDVEVSLTPLVYDFAPATRLVLRDISKGKKALIDLRESEIKFNEFSNLLPEIVFEVDRDMNVIYANKALEEKTGIPLNDFLDRKISPAKLVGKKDKEKLLSNVKRMLLGERISGNIFEFNYKDRKFYFQIYSSPLFVNDEVAGIRGIAVDITQKRLSEQKLEENEKKINSIVQGSKNGIFTIDDKQKFTFINNAGLELFGYSESEIINQNFTLVLDENSKQLVINRYERRQKGENVPSQYQFTIVRKNGEQRRVEINSSVIKVGKNQSMTVANLSDVTERENKQKELDEAQNRLKAFFDANDDLMFVKDHSRRYLVGNKALCEFFNSPLEDILGKTDDQISQPGIINSCTISDKKVIENREIINLEEKLGDHYFSVTKFPIVVNEEVLIGGILHDITNRKRNEKLQKVLLNISQKSTFDFSLHEFIANIHSQLQTILKAENFYIALYHKESDLYDFPYYHDEYDDVTIGDMVDMKHSLTDYVRRSEKGILVNNETWKEIDTGENITIMGEHTTSWDWMGAPIINTYLKDVVGVLAVQDYDTNSKYSHNDLLAIEIIAGYIGQFIAHLQTIQDLRTAKLIAQENENRYRALFNDSASVMLLIEVDTGRIVGANQSACVYYGYAYEELISMNINQINSLSDEEVKIEMEKAVNEERQHFFFRHRLANGELRHVEVYSSTVLVDDKPLLYSIIRDTTEKKRSEEEIARLSTALQQSPEPIALTNLDGVFIFVNKRYCELSGYSEEELLGAHTRILKSGVQPQEFYIDLWDTIKNGKTWYGEIVNRKRNGEHFIEEVNIAPIINEFGVATHYLKVSRDVTKQKKMVKELVTAKEKAEESDRLKSAFLANMSHEIRTPMNGILGFTSLLNESHFSDSDKQIFIESIQKSGDRMLNTVNDIIEISKIEVGEVTLRKKMVNINTKITEIVDFFLPEAMEKGLGLDSRLSLDNETALLFTDESKFESIVTNLIKNAIKYSDSGNIEFGYQVSNESFEFYCKDDGIGIPEDRKEAIFNRFEQADIDDKRVFQGSGLGLSITKAYVEMLDGKIWVNSVVDKGSVFRFNIPAVLSNISNTAKVNESCIKVEVPVDNELTVLVAEDDEVSLSYLEIILYSKVKKLLFAANGLEAVEAVKNHPEIDIVFMDIQLPVMDGYQATKNIRTFNNNVKIVAQTAYALQGDKELALKAGCDDYLSKPINKPALLEILEKYKV